MIKFRRVAAMFSILVVLGLSSKVFAQKPNVIIIYTDDQGAIDLNSYGANDLVTPGIDDLVYSGIKFTQF